MSQIVTVFCELTDASHTLSGGVNKWYAGIIVISIVASKNILIEKLSWIHNILRIEYFLYRFHIGDLCCAA